MAEYNPDIVIGREEEKEILANILASKEAELLAIYGRRRIGKTFLIRRTYAKQLAFEFSGIHDANLSAQLENFSKALGESLGFELKNPKTWADAFQLLENYLKPLIISEKKVIFFDEFPWIQTQRSGFLQAFGHFWNRWASQQHNLIVVICGSSASWMIQKVLNDRGGLHNRVTRRIRLLPFTIREASEYLHHRGVRLDYYQTIELYMAMGGIPQYLREIKAGESSAQAINRICFSKNGFLATEFPNLFRSLFEDSQNHTDVIIALSKKPMGLTRNEIIEECDFSSGGGATQVLNELTESGFITAYIPFQKKHKDSIYKLTDEYSLFYARFISRQKTIEKDLWQRITESTAWRAWSGYAFEGLCMKHIADIKTKLGIAGVYTEVSIWRHPGTKTEQGAQIDLVIDRQDKCINLCEIKFVNGEFVIDKKYAAELDSKVRIFKEQTKTRKTLFPTIISTYGVRKNDHYVGRVQGEVQMDIFFKNI